MVRGGLTRRQRQVLEFIARKIRERGYPPSVREIGEGVGLRSSSTVHGHLNRLEDKGYIRRDPTKPRAIELLRPLDEPARSQPAPPAPGRPLVTLPVLGRVPAGRPLLAVEQADDAFALPRAFVGSEEGFLLRVTGDSMIGAGIHDGDLVLVRRQDWASDGDIVVALTDDEEATVKRFYREGSTVRLQPENPALAPIRLPADRVRILGKVVGLFRRLG